MLPDQTTFTPETGTGKVRTRIVQLLLLSSGEAACRRMAASGQHSPKALRSAARLAALPEANDAGNLSLLVEYLTCTQDPESIRLFDETMKDHGIDRGKTLMTYAEELLEEGRSEGRAEGRMQRDLEVVQGCLQAGITWDVITAATGLTEASFEELKARLPGSDS